MCALWLWRVGDPHHESFGVFVDSCCLARLRFGGGAGCG
jgi:hypothetical protein